MAWPGSCQFIFHYLETKVYDCPVFHQTSEINYDTQSNNKNIRTYECESLWQWHGKKTYNNVHETKWLTELLMRGTVQSQTATTQYELPVP